MSRALRELERELWGARSAAASEAGGAGISRARAGDGFGSRGGAIAAVAEAARNVACTGARPLALTNCLNFGRYTVL